MLTRELEERKRVRNALYLKIQLRLRSFVPGSNEFPPENAPKMTYAYLLDKLYSKSPPIIERVALPSRSEIPQSLERPCYDNPAEMDPDLPKHVYLPKITK